MRRVRVISYAWGDKYVDDFLSLTLPALLAPGNMPYLAERYDLDLVFLTEERQFDRIRRAPSWRRLETVCTARLVSLDDLIVGYWYGISLSKALLRGYADLGDAALDAYLIFLNADFIVADGSYRSLAAKIEAGERLIFAPSYCIVRETALPHLRAHLADDVLAMPPRAMAAVGIRHRHDTIRAKTVNQRLFRIHRYDQFYWAADDQTILARQMPIALVCMRPEKLIPDMRTFWDYGVVSEICPTLPHCVLGDSDDYLMIELRDERTFEDLIGLGWPTVEEIAADLSSFTTKDQRDHLPYELTLHAGDLPANLAQARREFQAFLDTVAAKLSPKPVDHLNHRFWTDAVGRFESMRAEFLAQKARQTEAEASEALPDEDALTLVTDDPPPHLTDERHTPHPEPAAVQVHRADARPFRQRLRARAAVASERLFGRVPFVGKAHPYWADLRHALHAVAERGSLDQQRLLLVGPGSGSLFERLALKTERHLKLTVNDLLAGEPPPFERHGDLTVEVQGADGPRTMAASAVRVREAGRAKAPDWPPEAFDLCVCELSRDQLARFGDLFAILRPRMKPGGRIVALHVDRDLDGGFLRDGALIRTAFPREGRSAALFSGALGTRLARRLMARAMRAELHGQAQRLAVAGASALAALMSLVSARSVERQNPYKLGRHATSLTMVIDV